MSAKHVLNMYSTSIDSYLCKIGVVSIPSDCSFKAAKQTEKEMQRSWRNKYCAWTKRGTE